MRKCIVTNDDEAASEAGRAVGECNPRYEDGGDEPLVNGGLKPPAIAIILTSSTATTRSMPGAYGNVGFGKGQTGT